MDEVMEELQLYSNTQSHWSSGSTVCFPPRVTVVCIPRMHPHLQWNRVLLLAMSCFSGDPNVILVTGFIAPLGWCFTRLHANDVKSRELCRPSVDASQGFAPTIWKANMITHHMPSPVQFCSLQVLLLLSTQWLVRPVMLLGGALWRPCSFTPILSLPGPEGQLFASRPGGQRFVSRGCTHTSSGTRFSLAMSRYQVYKYFNDKWHHRTDDRKILS
jgi:hypothetical protein